MLNILIFSPLALASGRGGEISSMELASGLQKYFKITLIDTNRIFQKKLLPQKVINRRLKSIDKIRTMRFATAKIFGKDFSFPYPKECLALYKWIKKNEVIYFSYFNLKDTIMFIFFSLLHRQGKFIVGYRKPFYSKKLFSLYNLKYRMSILFLSLFKKRIYHHTLSYHAKKFLENFYHPNSIFHITHGIDLQDYLNNGKQEKKSDILNFIYVGYLDDIHKGVGVLIDAIDEFLSENHNLKIFFEFCGMGVLELKIIKLEKKYPDYVKFNGYISNELTPLFYKKSDVFMFSSRVEPFPRVIIEALAAKLVILCSKTIGSIELLKGKDFAFFVSDLNINAIKDKFYEIYNLWLDNPIKFKELQNLARDYVVENYSFNRELEEFKTFINYISKKL